MQTKIRFSLFVKIVAPLIVLIALTVGISGYRIYQASTERWQSEMDTRLERTALLIASTVDPALLDRVRLPTDLDNDVYSRIAGPMEAAQTAGNVDWIGIYYRQADHLYYWVDTSGTGVGYPFFYPSAAHVAAFADQLPHKVEYTDEFGSYYGFVAPIIVDGAGGPEVLGLVEASLEAESAQLLQRAALQQVWPILAAGIVAAVAVTTAISYLAFLRPIHRLKRGALALAAGELGHTIELRSHDELGDLAATFNQMSARLAQLYLELQEHNRLLEERVATRTVELRSERNRLDTILQNVADGLAFTDPDGRIVLANPAFSQSVRSPLEQLIGRPLEQVFPSKTLAALLQRSLSRPGEVYTATVEPDGPSISAPVYKASACALASEADPTAVLGMPQVQGVVTVLRDITQEAEVDRMKTEFISTVSHELRTPLTSVLGFAKLIGKSFERDVAPKIDAADRRGQQATQRIHENLEIIISEAERLTRLINDVLDIAKMEAGKIEWHVAEVPISAVIRDSVATISTQAEAKGLQVRVEIEPNLPPVRADEDRLVQLVTNLLSNAVKFTDTGGITVRARELVVSENETLDGLGAGAPLIPAGYWLAVGVQDTGVGIQPDRIPQLFQKFKQLSDTMNNRPKGTGLGLAICREIVEHYGGKIWAESAAGGGSTFTFVLPLSTIRAVGMEKVRQRVAEAVPAGSPSSTILVVDDEDNIRQLLGQELGGAGYRVLEAHDGLEALNRARQDHPALIVLDLMMPNMNGLDVLRVLKGDPVTAPIPVMILSVIEDREQGLRLGADEYLTKPLDAERLLRTVAGLLDRAARGEGRKKVLLIDEDAAVVETIGRVLRERGYEVTEAGDGQTALERARQSNPDLIILDAMISKIDNYHVLRALKSEAQEAIVIVLSATASPEEVAEFMKQGADRCGEPGELPGLLDKE